MAERKDQEWRGKNEKNRDGLLEEVLEEQEKVHNRWHPDIPPALEVEPEEEVYLQTRDALDGQITRSRHWQMCRELTVVCAPDDGARVREGG